MFDIFKNIKPCPYCGGKGFILKQNKKYYIECENKCAVVGGNKKKKETRKSWNEFCERIKFKKEKK